MDPVRVSLPPPAFTRPPASHRACIVVGAVLCSAALVVAAGATTPADEIHWTITGPTSVTFDWHGGEGAIRFGRSPANLGDSVVAVTPVPTPDSAPGPFREAKITGLRENTVYYYRIGNQAVHSFLTPPPRGSSDFWFAEEADIGSSRTYPNAGITQAMIAADHPDIPGDDRPQFVLVVGDISYGDDHGLDDVDQHFNDVMAWSLTAAYMPIWGNHDWATVADTAIDNLNNYEGRFDLPNSQTSPGASEAIGDGPGEDWYWFDYGNVRFISFPEPYAGAWNDWENRVMPIMAAAQADPAITFIVTFGHRPSWSSGRDAAGLTSLATKMASLRAACSKYVLCFQAHSHHYERSNPAQTDGVLFLNGSGGGASLGGLDAVQPGWSAFRINHLEHVRIYVRADRIDGYAICGPDGSSATDTCTPGTIIDSWTIPAPVTVGISEAHAGRPRLGLRAEPNPGLGAVALRVETDAAGHDVLDVLDLSGRLVRRLSRGWFEGGTRRVHWDGTADSGARAPSGTYLVRLRSGDRSATALVTLLR
jgi:flagellar hook capping protein FlgD/purple acid phosphatase-like protein/calcineurin-like phosphoesterase family protein